MIPCEKQDRGSSFKANGDQWEPTDQPTNGEPLETDGINGNQREPPATNGIDCNQREPPVANGIDDNQRGAMGRVGNPKILENSSCITRRIALIYFSLRKRGVSSVG